LAAVTVKTDDVPAATDVGLALILTDGATAAAVTVTVAVAVLFPPVPVAVAV
jgi:hypothetical protein